MNRTDLIARIRDSGGDELTERLVQLEAMRCERARQSPRPGEAATPPDASAAVDYDVVLAGGGLSLLLAPVLADQGLRVGVFERHRAGTAHREWNASAPELRPLVEAGLFSDDEVQALVVARYAQGVCRWHRGGRYPVQGVLDNAVDAGALLDAVRDRAVVRGVEIHDGHALVGERFGEHGVSLRFAVDGATREVSTRVLVDARGASSPYARSDLLCPTVGGVLTGLASGPADDELDPGVGDILVTTEGVEDGRQHIWEGFPGRPGELTTYQFYYARSDDVPDDALLRLYARFFDTLPRYKRGAARLLRPTFGYIPGWSRLGPPSTPPHARCVLVGDAAARQSPLTFCGFGHMLRTFVPVSRSIAALVRDQPVPRFAGSHVLEDEAIHAGTGALAMMIAVPPRRPDRAGALNELLDTAFGVLHGLGNDDYAALLKDQMAPEQFIGFLREAARRRPVIYREILSRLGPLSVAHWGYNLVRERVRAAT
ncbi:MAG: lycopene cyclase [Pseudomonadota bacterium]